MEQPLYDLFTSSDGNFRHITLEQSNGPRRCATARYNCLVVVDSGSFSLQYKERVFKRVGAGMMILIPSHTHFCIEISSQVGATIVYLTSELAIYETSLWNVIVNKAKVQLDVEPLYVHSVLKDFFALIGSYAASSINLTDIYQHKIEELFLTMKYLYSRAELECFFAPMATEEVDFREFVLYNYKKVGSVEEFARLAGCSLSTFKRRFAKYYDISAYQWLQIQRAKLVLQDIADNLLTLNQISVKHGFASPSHFSRFCRVYFENPPSKVKLQMQLKYGIRARRDLDPDE